MTDETVAAAGAEQTANPSVETTITPDTTTAPDTGTEQTTETEVKTETTESTPEPEPKKTPWFQKRFDQLTAEKWQERQRADSLAATIEAMKKGQTEGQPTIDPASFQSAVEQESTRKLAEAKFNEACNTTYSKGSSEFNDFDATIANFKMLGGLPQDVLDVTTQIENGHKVLYALGKDLEEAARVLSLPPTQRAFELARLSLQPEKPRPLSSAPKPIKPIDGAPKGSVDLEKVPIEEYARIRNQQDAERRGRGR